jgi:hypothetical protein
MHNIYLLEKTLQREIAERRAATERLEQVRALRTVPSAPRAGERGVAPASGPRVLLRVGRLVLTWLA